MSADQIPIGRFSLITRLSQKALRCYDKKGLLSPSQKDLCSGYRYYSASQLARGVAIKALTSLGFSLDDIGIILAAKDADDSGLVKELFKGRRREIRSEIDRLQRIEAILADRGASLESIYMSLTDPIIKEVSTLRVISIREKGTYEETISRNIGRLFGIVFSPENQRAGLRMTGPCITLYHDGEYREADADIEVAIPVTGHVTLNDPVLQVRNLTGGKFLTLVHHGSYRDLHASYARLYAYAEERGIPLTAPGRELYINSPQDVAEKELMTEIQVPVSG